MLSEQEKKQATLNLEKPIYRIYEAADILGVHERTIRNYIKNGAIKAGQVGRQWRISKADLLEYMAPKNS